MAKLILEDGSEFAGKSFGAEKAMAGEVVFSTGMTGYPESLTDPSYKGQILILTYPLIGNYGVPDKKYWESNSIKISGLVVSNYINTPSHFQSKQTLSQWLKEENIPGLEIADTRFLTQKIRVKGTMLGKIIFDKDIEFYNPDKENLVAQVSTQKIVTAQPHPNVSSHSTPGLSSYSREILLIDCGAKENIIRCLLKRNVRVSVVPWDYDPFDLRLHLPGEQSRHLEGVGQFDGIVISNGPGDPKMADKTIATIKKALAKKIPILGVCLGNQILALAAGGDTQKLKFGHRSQNQPCLLEKSGKCYITTQNHGFAVSKIPKGFKAWFTNANDSSNEGIIHKKLPFMSVQFHPEANPGPTDTEWIFDYFLERIT
ncbi:MAG: glutamine-hydrolyzing carbamoyl-phosphate synthase small subunit [Candidatus Levybacteria bacterium]|nr:glutamine-hydrolyzing carbamoyl-phosphate synthase small subunit [Candidatus Levybacteria bacterium]